MQNIVDQFALLTILDDEFMSALVEQIHVSNQGEFTLIPKLGNQKILFGKHSNVLDKIDRLKVFYWEAIPYEGWR